MPAPYRKTQKGVSEIETRTHRLLPRLRTTLVMVDGRRSDDELVATLGPAAAEALSQLAGQGFVERVEAPPAPSVPAPVAPVAAAPAAATAAPVASPSDFTSHRRAAVRAFADQLGPAADNLAVRMEKAASFDELYPLVQRAAQLIAGTHGRAAAEAYWSRFGPPG